VQGVHTAITLTTSSSMDGWTGGTGEVRGGQHRGSNTPMPACVPMPNCIPPGKACYGSTAARLGATPWCVSWSRRWKTKHSKCFSGLPTRLWGIRSYQQPHTCLPVVPFHCSFCYLAPQFSLCLCIHASLAVTRCPVFLSCASHQILTAIVACTLA
jgi:hypothetical protein